MSRIINRNAVGTRRQQLCKAVAITLRELAGKTSVDDEARDMVAFVTLCLNKIHNTIDETVSAWEKRNYWIKADRFRRDWSWTQKKQEQISQALLHNDWVEIAHIMPEIATQLRSVKTPKRNTIGDAWTGAYQLWHKSIRQ